MLELLDSKGTIKHLMAYMLLPDFGKVLKIDTNPKFDVVTVKRDGGK